MNIQRKTQGVPNRPLVVIRGLVMMGGRMGGLVVVMGGLAIVMGGMQTRRMEVTSATTIIYA